MNAMRRVQGGTLARLLCFALLWWVCQELTARPNVLIIVADDLGWGDLASHGNREVKTPRLDAFAESGLRFDKFYACPTGAASLASLLTGRYHYRTGVCGDSGPAAVMFDDETTLGELFRDNGYSTAWFGNWRHGLNYPHNAIGQGFAEGKLGNFPTKEVTDWIGSRREKSWFCTVVFPWPKISGTTAKDCGLELSGPESRLKEVHHLVAKLDAEAGKLIDTASQNPDTIILFLSDNGPDQFGKTTGRYNQFLYGGKGSVHEGGVRIPCFVSWPGRIEAGSRFTRIASVIDWLPTFMEFCELKPPERFRKIDGISLGKMLQNGGSRDDWPNRILFTSWTPPGYQAKTASVAVRSDRWLALRDPRWRRDEKTAANRGGWELYDLRTDPFQKHDQGDEYPFLLSDLKADYLFWMDETTDDGLGPIPIHIGHAEWPVVSLPPNKEKTWPVRVVEPGLYQVEARFAGGKSKVRYRFKAGEREVEGKGTIELSAKVSKVQLETEGQLVEVRITKTRR